MRGTYWAPPLLWMAMITALSSASFSAVNTGSVLIPIFRELLPWVTPAGLEALHAVARKLAHFTEYAVLAALWFRACRGGLDLAPRRAAWLALAVSMSWAFLDEAHQALLPSRTASARDVVLDASGSVFALVLLRRGWLRWPPRRSSVRAGRDAGARAIATAPGRRSPTP